MEFWILMLLITISMSSALYETIKKDINNNKIQKSLEERVETLEKIVQALDNKK